MYAGYLKHLIILNTTITFLIKIGGQRNNDEGILLEILESLDDLQKELTLLKKHVQRVSTKVFLCNFKNPCTCALPQDDLKSSGLISM